MNSLFRKISRSAPDVPDIDDNYLLPNPNVEFSGPWLGNGEPDLRPVGIYSQREKERGRRSGVVIPKSVRNAERPKWKLDKSRKLSETENKRREMQVVKASYARPETSQKVASCEKEKPRAMSQKPWAVDEEPRAVDEEPRAVYEEPRAVDEEPRAVDEEPRAVDEEPRAVDEEPRVVDEELQEAEKERQKKDKELIDLYIETKIKHEQDFLFTEEWYEQESRELDLRYEKEKKHRDVYMKVINDHRQLWDQHERLLKQHLEERKLRKQSEKELEAALGRCVQVEKLYEDEKKARRALEMETQGLQGLLNESKQLRDKFETAKDENFRYGKEVQQLTAEINQIRYRLEKEIRLGFVRGKDLTAQYESERQGRLEARERLATAEDFYREQLNRLKREREDDVLRLTVKFEEQLRTAADEKEELLRQINHERQKLTNKNIAQELFSKDRVSTPKANT